ncbi:hypothetical protein DDZ13_06160 [Coraliomargarita sinensis]|uniref:Uncharacterized protein n=1 Tax=Coraliomargarita sinensis TaxID=2174842 RepID=A0A317ZH28_9BACT|nr:hypothetical protein [Coraliomargarita sinensis]PXA04750.1 hypothetical protein DDZ13_06160 [Coraliomargarita sinensis]
MSSSFMEAIPGFSDLVGRKAERVEEKRVEKKFWSGKEQSRLQDKTFPIKEWNKHFSSLGSKRAPITLDEKKKKERFEVEVLDRKTMDLEMSRWNERMADLHKRADIKMDKEAELVADRKLYNMMLQDSPHYMELAEELSMRDLNRFQFRRNRSDDGVSVKKAGSGDE